MCWWSLRIFCFLVVLLIREIRPYELYNPTIYDEMRKNPDISMFEEILLDNTVVRDFLEYFSITIFSPVNAAIQRYGGDMDKDLVFYHLCLKTTINEYRKSTPLYSLLNIPVIPLWITKVNGDVYVNQARIIQSRVVYREPNKTIHQALHVIDRVLDLKIKLPVSPQPSARVYDFLKHIHKWNFRDSMSITKFHQKIQQYELVDLYNSLKPHTFFIPVNSGTDSYKYGMINRKVILGHVVHDQVVFSRPEGRVVNTTDEDGTLHTFFFERINDTVLLQYASYFSTGMVQYTIKVMEPDIPLQNGVVHLISEPLGNFLWIPKPFPYLPIIKKVTNDPEIEVFYQMGRVTGFNDILDRENVSFTYFIPKDSAWYRTSKLGLEPVASFNNILARHLVISGSPYSMQQLASMTRDNYYSPIKLRSEKGILRISVFEIDGRYFIKWRKKYIEVLKPDYVCSNGVVHIMGGPFVNFRPRDLKNGSINLDNYWKIVNNIGV